MALVSTGWCRVLLLSACLFSMCLFSAGCGMGQKKEPVIPSVPVSGGVTLDGKPLATATVTFYPEEGAAGIECTGVTDDSGKYQLHPLRGGEGAPAGKYKVTVSHYTGPGGKPLVMTKDSPPPADLGAVESLPGRYSDLRLTTLTATVPPEGGTVDFELKSK